MLILSVDPGTTRSGFVVIDSETRDVLDAGVVSNDVMLMKCRGASIAGIEMLVYEQIAAQGLAVGFETFETCFWSGAFAQAFHESHSVAASPVGSSIVRPVKRHQVKTYLCGTQKAKDANIRRALLDLYGGDAAGKASVKCPACKGKGSKSAGFKGCFDVCTSCNGSGKTTGGRLAGVTSHALAALAAGITFLDRKDGDK